jgi:hypothetical protein
MVSCKIYIFLHIQELAIFTMVTILGFPVWLQNQ